LLADALLSRTLSPLHCLEPFDRKSQLRPEPGRLSFNWRGYFSYDSRTTVHVEALGIGISVDHDLAKAKAADDVQSVCQQLPAVSAAERARYDPKVFQFASSINDPQAIEAHSSVRFENKRRVRT
jgi:hypothetical protein